MAPRGRLFKDDDFSRTMTSDRSAAPEAALAEPRAGGAVAGKLKYRRLSARAKPIRLSLRQTDWRQGT
jgi:hypothetical protein